MDRRDYMAQFGKEIEEGFDVAEMVWVVVMEDDDGLEETVKLPARYVVCGTCDGKGKHVNPSIDSHGIGEEEWDRDWSHEDKENYHSGMYDIQCNECKGRTTTPSINHELVTKSMNKKWQEALQYEQDRLDGIAADARERAAELKYGY